MLEEQPEMDPVMASITFSSANEAFQHLANLTGKKIKIAQADELSKIDDLMDKIGADYKSGKFGEREYDIKNLGKVFISLRWSGIGFLWSVEINDKKIDGGRNEDDKEAVKKIEAVINKELNKELNKENKNSLEIMRKEKVARLLMLEE